MSCWVMHVFQVYWLKMFSQVQAYIILIMLQCWLKIILPVTGIKQAIS